MIDGVQNNVILAADMSEKWFIKGKWRVRVNNDG